MSSAGRRVLCIAAGLCATALSAAPAQMQAIVQHGYGGPEVLHLEFVPVPVPGPGQVRVQIYAVGVNPFDWGHRMQRPDSSAAAAMKIIPGGEIAGRIDALGPGVSRLRPGEAVYGQLARLQGGYAQYVVIPAYGLAPKPERFTFEQAAGAAEAGRTAMHVMEDAHLHAGETVVVIGAAGGEGSAFVQLAKAQGARVIAMASSQHNRYLKGLGADQIVNYDRGESAQDSEHDADVVINTVGGQADAALGYVRRGGTLLLVAGKLHPEQCAMAGVSCPNEQGIAEYAESVADLLARLNQLVDAGKYRVHIQKTFPLAQAAEAEEFNRSGHAEGKVVIDVRADATEH